MKTILHITPHFGGGAGTVISAIIDGVSQLKSWHQEVVCFEYLNEYGKEWSEKQGIKVSSEISPDDQWFHNLVCRVDIVHLHFWNHPATYKFLYSFSGKKCRMIFWSHANGHHPPYLFNDVVLEYPHLFVVASEYSLKAKPLLGKSEEWKNRHLRNVFSCSGTKGYESIVHQAHDGFNIGYIGTVDYCKMHKDFIDICSQVKIPNAKFIVCGGPNHRAIEQEALEKGFSTMFDFKGHVSDIKIVLSELDLFAYPLNSDNYGTGEQVLIEAMSAGIPQIVLDNGPEAFVIIDGVTGVVAKNIKEYVLAIEKMYVDPTMYKSMSTASREYAQSKYSLTSVVEEWNNLYNELFTQPKEMCIFKSNDSMNYDLPTNLFLIACGNCETGDVFREALSYFPREVPEVVINKLRALPDITRSETRGSVQHYNSFFNDERLKYLTNLMVELI